VILSYPTKTLDGHQVKTPDGRQLSTQTYGDPDGKPVFLLHGTPGSRLGPHPRGILLHRLGVRLIAFDRPGYGESDRFQGRRVADADAAGGQQANTECSALHVEDLLIRVSD